MALEQFSAKGTFNLTGFESEGNNVVVISGESIKQRVSDGSFKYHEIIGDVTNKLMKTKNPWGKECTWLAQGANTIIQKDACRSELFEWNRTLLSSPFPLVSSITLQPLLHKVTSSSCAPALDAAVRTFQASNYKLYYTMVDCVPNEDTLFLMVQVVMKTVATAAGEDALHKYMSDLQRDVARTGATTLSTQCAAIWTSPLKLVGLTFYGTIQQLIREDKAGQLLRDVVTFVKTLNATLVCRGPDLNDLQFPDRLFRGSWLQIDEVRKFKVDVEYRVPMLLATSEERTISTGLLALFQKNTATHWPVLFVFHIDGSLKCTQANLLEDYTTVKTEREWLFVPYSTFKVRTEAVISNPTVDNPVVIHIDVHPDNKAADEQLPLFWWH